MGKVIMTTAERNDLTAELFLILLANLFASSI